MGDYQLKLFPRRRVRVVGAPFIPTEKGHIRLKKFVRQYLSGHRERNLEEIFYQTLPFSW